MSGLWPIVFRSIFIHRARSLLTGIAVALGVAIVLGVQIGLAGLDSQAQAVRRQQVGDADLDVRVTAGPGLNAPEVEALSRLPGVRRAEPLVEKRVTARADPNDVSGHIVILVGLQGGAAALRPVSLAAGRLPTPGSHSEVTIDQGLVTVLRSRGGQPMRIGGTVLLTTGTGPDAYTVVGLTSGTSAGPSFTRSAVFIDAATLAASFPAGLHTSLVGLSLQPGSDRNRVARAVRAELAIPLTVADPLRGGSSPTDQIRPLLLLLTALSLIVGAGVTANGVSLSAFERRREIALLRTAGAGARQVFQVFAAEAAIVAALAAPFGVLIGIGLGFTLVHGFAAPDLPQPTPNVPALMAFLAAGLGWTAALVGALIPAAIAARTPVLAGLRNRLAERDRPRPWLTVVGIAMVAGAGLGFASAQPASAAFGAGLLLAGVVAVLPALVPLISRILGRATAALLGEASVAAANLVGRRNRTALTLSGLTISVAAAVAIASLTGGALAAGDQWVNSLLIGDAIVRGPVTEPDSLAVQLSLVPGVRSVIPVRLFSVVTGPDVVGIATVDTATYRRRGGLDITVPDRATAMRSLGAEPAVLVPAGLAASTGWGMGTTIPLGTDHGAEKFRVVGVVAHSFPAGDGRESLIMDRAIARRYLGPVATGFDNLQVSLDGDGGALAHAAADYGLQAVTVATIRDSSRLALQHSVGLLLALAALSVITAMLAVINTLLVNVRQGARDVALLRAVGLGRRGALGLVLTESAILAATGVIVGVGTGCLLALPLLRASATPGFAPSFTLPTGAIVVMIATVVGGAVLAVLGPARRSVNTGIIASIRYE